MSGNRGCITNSCLFMVIVFLPIIGQVILTLMVFEDQHSPSAMLLWLVLIWVIPFFGPFLYLLFGQQTANHGRIMFGQASYPYQQQ